MPASSYRVGPARTEAVDRESAVPFEPEVPEVHRQTLTTTHPHGYVLARPDRSLALLRISKNASTESKVRLGCADWLAFGDYEGAVVAFLREPVARFLSSVPETILRMTHLAIVEEWRKDRVVIPEETYRALMGVAREPIETVLSTFLDEVEYSFFDAHHEPQHAFFTDRRLELSLDPLLYLTESFETAIEQIEARLSISTERAAQRGNAGGAKPVSGRTPLIDLARRLSRTGVYREVQHAGFLGRRYRNDAGPIELRDLNDLANRFSRELKQHKLDAATRDRILAIYAIDHKLWALATERGGDIPASDLWPLALAQ